MQQVFYILILALFLLSSCMDDITPIPVASHYIKATVGDHEIIAYQEKGEIVKDNGSSGDLNLEAHTKSGERIHIEILKSLVPGKYIIDGDFSFNDSIVISIFTHIIPGNEAELTYGEMVIEELHHHPLILKGTFSGSLIYDFSPQGPSNYDTVLVKNGVMDVAF